MSKLVMTVYKTKQDPSYPNSSFRLVTLHKVVAARECEECYGQGRGDDGFDAPYGEGYIKGGGQWTCEECEGRGLVPAEELDEGWA